MSNQERADDKWTPENEKLTRAAMDSITLSVQTQIGMLINAYQSVLWPRTILAGAAEAAIAALITYEQASHDVSEGRTPEPLPTLDPHRAMLFGFMIVNGCLESNKLHKAGSDPDGHRVHPMIEAAEWLGKIIAPEPLPQWVNQLVDAAAADQARWHDSRAMGEVAGRA